jgi:hypothetical protein
MNVAVPDEIDDALHELDVPELSALIAHAAHERHAANQAITSTASDAMQAAPRASEIVAHEAPTSAPPSKRRRGRPPGSKNKKTLLREAQSRGLANEAMGP